MVAKLRKSFGVGLFILIATCAFVLSAHAQSAEDHYNKAEELLDHRLYDQSIAEITKAIEIDPTVAKYYNFRGELYRTRTSVVDAIADYSKSIEIDPKNGEIYYYRAVCYYATKDYPKAWGDVHKAQSLGYQVFEGFINVLKNASGQNS